MNNYNYLFVSSNDLTKQQIEAMYQLNIELYPEFAYYYNKNRYYSTIKPQYMLQVFDGDKLIAVGKLLWKELDLKGQDVKFFAFGFLVREEYQKQGIGTRMAQVSMEKARSLGADLLYASTHNPLAVKLMLTLGFEELKIKITYKNVLNGEIEQEQNLAYAYEFKKGILTELNSLESFYIGEGPV